jgi:hypothetical protein
MILHSKGRLELFLCIIAALAFTGGVSAQDSSRSSGWIVIPAADYQSLRARAYPIEPSPEPPPVQATLTRINYDLTITGEMAAGQAILVVDVIKDGWVRIPIPSSLLVREAKLDGKPVPLVGGDQPNAKSAVFNHQGRAELQLDIVLPVTTTAANESISLPPAVAGITRASIQLPRQGIEVKLTGGFLSEKSEAAAKSRWVAYGRGSEPLVFSWWKKADDHRSSQPLRMRGSLTELVGLGEDSTSIQAEVNAEILQGAAQEIRIQLPDKVAINQVAGAMVADWEMRSGELAVTFIEPVEKTARFLIGGETRTARDGQIDIPLLRLLNAERETGGVAVEVLGAGEIKDRKSAGLESADASDLGEFVSNRQSPSLLAFRFRSGDAKASRSLAVNVARYTQEAVLMANIEEARYRILMSNEGKSLVQARYAIRNNQRNFLKIALPPNAVIWSATLSGKPIRPGQTSDSSLLLPLEKARAGEEAPAFSVEVLYFSRGDQWNNSGKCKLALPLLDLPVSRTGLQYFYPPLHKVTLEPGAFRMQVYQEPTSAALNAVPASPGSGSGGGMGSAEVSALPLVNNNIMDLVKVMAGTVGQDAKLSEKATQALVDRYRAQSQDGKRAGILPIKMDFPAFGPSIFLVSELTAENQSPTIEINYEAEKKGGAR